MFSSPLPDITIPDDNLYSFMKKHLMQHPEDELFIDGVTYRIWTAKELVDAAEKIAGGLMKRGFKREDVACLFSINCPEFAGK